MKITKYNLVFTDSVNKTSVYNGFDKLDIKLLVLLLKKSNVIKPNDIGSKASKESYFLTFYEKTVAYDKLRISKTSDNYGIISPGESYYIRNDKLIYAMDSLLNRKDNF